MEKKLFSQRNKLCYFISVWGRRILRYRSWYFTSIKFSKVRDIGKLPYRVKKHQSVLIRKLGDSDIQLQLNKVENLKIAIKKIDGMVIRPGEVFSFCKTVGRPTRKKGYLEGMELAFGEARPGIGGGLCQIANLLNWLVIHSPLTVIERHHHNFDPFPDNGRVLPFGSGATIFYNYEDFQVKNNTNHTFQIHLWISEKCLEGELRIDEELDYSYHVFEKNHRFVKVGDKYYRQNEIRRNKIAKLESVRVLETELVTKNDCLVKYVPREELIVKD